MVELKNGAKETVKATPDSKKSSHSQKSSKTSSPSTPKKNSDLVSYKVKLLDGDQKPLEISISKNADGQVLFNKVCDELGGIIERDYFGLRYMDKNNQRQWLDLGRNVKKQIAGAHSAALSFRVKHYPGNPITDFHQEISQYLLYLQIRRDLVQGRLLCPLNELYTIGALILQSEYGDAPEYEDSRELNGSVSDEENKAYFKNFKIVFNQTRKIESEIIARHKTYRGLTERDAEIEVIKRASKLPTYGVDPFPVKVITKEKTPKKADTSSHKTTPTGDATNNSVAGANQSETQSSKSAPASPAGSVYLGLRHTGLTTYVGLQPSENIEWDSIERLACDGKDFIVYVKPTTASDPETQSEVSPIPQEGEAEEEQPSASASGKSGKKQKSAAKKGKPKKEKQQKKSTIPAKSAGKRVKPKVVTFRCDTKAAALALWKWTVDRQSFFTLKKASEAKTAKTTHGLFRRSHSYRFIGKSQMELKSITNSAESLPQPSFVRVSSLRRPKSHEGEFDPLSTRATLPARIRSTEDGSESAKRPPILSTSDNKAEPSQIDETSAIPTTEDQTPAAATIGVMSIANDLLAAPGSEESTPVKEVAESEPVTVVPISVNPVTASPPESTDVDEVHQRVNHVTKPAPRDSECLRAVKEIDQAIESVQSDGQKQKAAEAVETTLPNGEAPPHEIKTTSAPVTSSGVRNATRTAGASSDTFCSRSSLIIAMEAAAVVGVLCLGVVIAALETDAAATVPGRQSGFWTDLAMNLQGQPIVASFNEYIYAPLRGLFIGGGR
ncbi:hypothetical protein Aperf_G00000039338 [Anoplocephala perfoliata]